ncbi:Outer membrane protein assembly factor BamA [uncultured Gammaproteobacteria bacterium]
MIGKGIGRSKRWAAALAVVGVCGATLGAAAQPSRTVVAALPADTGRSVAQVFTGGTISEIRVGGIQRIEEQTVRSYLVVARGDPFDPAKIDQSLKALFATGLFADVALRRDGNALVVAVVENPIINRIAFEGNKRLKEDQLQTEIQSRPRVVYTRTRVQNDVQRVLELYRRNGRFAATVEPKIIQLEQNRVDLVFEIDEGARTGVRRITFVGNEKFGDGTLREHIMTKESRWYRFLSSDDSYDPDRLAYDRELLRKYYLAEGFADFRVVSAVAELAPDKEDFYITFTIEEGERYHIGKVNMTTNLKGLDVERIRGGVRTGEGDWYDAGEVEKTVAELTTVVNDLQYPFVDIKPKVQRNRETLSIDLTYEVNEGPRVFVERIEITGNSRTLDKVIRREFLLAEGDPINNSKLKQSEQRIRDLGYFEKVNINQVDGAQPDQTVVQVEVTEQSTGELSFGAGFSTADGPLGDFSIRERNLLGRGQDLRIGATLSGRRQEYDLSFTEPYFLDRDVSAGFDVFHVTKDNQARSSYDEQDTGFSLRTAYPLADKLRQRLVYSLSQAAISNVPWYASRYIQDQKGTRVVSMVGQDLIYDARNSKLTPTRGFYVRYGTDFAGVGGDAQYIRNRFGAGGYYPVADQWILSLTGDAGHIVSVGNKLKIADRFFLGGDNLRGFQTAGVGPRDTTSGDALGGTNFARASLEMSFPLGLPEEFGLSGHVFSDAGTAGQVGFSDPNVRDVESLRMSGGAGVSWKSPFGPIRVDLAQAVAKEKFDKTEFFRFSFGTRF